MSLDEIGKRLFDARKNKKLTRAELGVILNLHESTIKRYEDGFIKTLSTDKIEDFANALGTTPAYIMGWEEKHVVEKPTTIAALLDGEELTEEETEELNNYIDFLISRRKKVKCKETTINKKSILAEELGHH